MFSSTTLVAKIFAALRAPTCQPLGLSTEPHLAPVSSSTGAAPAEEHSPAQWAPLSHARLLFGAIKTF